MAHDEKHKYIWGNMVLNHKSASKHAVQYYIECGQSGIIENSIFQVIHVKTNQVNNAMSYHQPSTAMTYYIMSQRSVVFQPTSSSYIKTFF